MIARPELGPLERAFLAGGDDSRSDMAESAPGGPGTDGRARLPPAARKDVEEVIVVVGLVRRSAPWRDAVLTNRLRGGRPRVPMHASWAG